MGKKTKKRKSESCTTSTLAYRQEQDMGVYRGESSGGGGGTSSIGTVSGLF